MLQLFGTYCLKCLNLLLDFVWMYSCLKSSGNFLSEEANGSIIGNYFSFLLKYISVGYGKRDLQNGVILSTSAIFSLLSLTTL